jgi:hypothetical protein
MMADIHVEAQATEQSGSSSMEAVWLPAETLAHYRILAERRVFASVEAYFASLVLEDQIDQDDLLQLADDELSDTQAADVRASFKSAWREIMTGQATTSWEDFRAELEAEDETANP